MSSDWDAPKAVTYREQLDRLTNSKKILEKRESVVPGDYAKEWLELSQKFEAIDAKANAHWCALHSKHYANPDSDAPVLQPVLEIEQEEPELFGWQRAANMGGG